jgi:hypothetical protein
MHNGELRNLYGLPDIIRVRWEVHAARTGEIKDYTILVEETVEKRQLERLSRVLQWILGIV